MEMEITMPTENSFQADPLGMRRVSPAEFLLLREQLVREARTARAAAVGAAIVRVFAAGLRWIRWLSSVMTEALALLDALTPLPQRRGRRHLTHHQ
jgi:hypothetical protein